MTLDVYTIIFLITNLFSLITIYKFITVYFDKLRVHKTVAIAAYISYFVFTSLACIVVNIPFIMLIVNWITLFAISLAYESSLQKKIVYVTYIIVFMLIPELIVGALTGYFHFSAFTEGSYSDSLGIVATTILTFIESLLMSNFKSSKTNRNVSWSYWLSSLIIPIISLVYEIIFVSNPNITQSTAVISVLMLFVLNFTAFYLYNSLAHRYVERSKLALLEKENELYCKQCEIMQNSTKELQAFRHDLNNQFIAISELLSENEYESAKEQLNKLLKLTKTKIIYSTTGNTAIDGIINYKLQCAANSDIKVKTELAVPNDLEINISDIITILGNLLDNAIEAVMKIPKEERYINVKLVYSQDRLIIRISNSFNGDIELENGEIITSKDEKNNHGLGLKNIKKVVEQNNGYMQVTHDEKIFDVDILLYTKVKI